MIEMFPNNICKKENEKKFYVEDVYIYIKNICSRFTKIKYQHCLSIIQMFFESSLNNLIAKTFFCIRNSDKTYIIQ